MELTARLARQLLDLDGSEAFGLGLGELAAGLARAVPSLLTVSLVLVHQGVLVPVTVRAEPQAEAAVLASLAVKLASEGGSLLILQAGERGAFLLLRDELAGLRSGRTPDPQVDQHLSPAGPPESALTAARDDLAAVNQAVGILLDRGVVPEAALAELRRRAELGGISVGAAGRALLAELDVPG